MKHRSHPLIAAVLLIWVVFPSHRPAHTFLANNGMLYESGDVRIAVDGLFGTEYDEYPPLPDTLRSQFESAVEPFAGMGIIAATHRHGDHMTPEAMASYLCASPSTIALVPTDVRSDVMDAAACELADDRVRSGTEPVELDGILVTPVPVPHVGDRWPDMDNRAYVIQSAGGRMVHLGDSDLSEELVSERIDILVTPYWNIGDERFMQLYEKAGRPLLIAVHVPPADRLRIRDRIASMGLDAWVPQQSMDALPE